MSKQQKILLVAVILVAFLAPLAGWVLGFHQASQAAGNGMDAYNDGLFGMCYFFVKGVFGAPPNVAIADCLATIGKIYADPEVWFTNVPPLPR